MPIQRLLAASGWSSENASTVKGVLRPLLLLSDTTHGLPAKLRLPMRVTAGQWQLTVSPSNSTSMMNLFGRTIINPSRKGSGKTYGAASVRIEFMSGEGAVGQVLSEAPRVLRRKDVSVQEHLLEPPFVHLLQQRVVELAVLGLAFRHTE